VWPIPITLDVPAAFAGTLSPGTVVALRDPEGSMLAALHVTDVYQPDRQAEAQAVYGTTTPEHPGVRALLEQSHPYYVGGQLEGLRLPAHYDFQSLRLTPAQVRAQFAQRGWTRVVAFQTRNPLHRAHVELTWRAARQAHANLLIHPVVGLTKPGDVDHYTRVRCYKAVLPHYPAHSAALALLPLAMRMAGPREALWHAIIRQNFGCDHFIVGRDHAGPGKDASGQPFYGPYDAQRLLQQYEPELGVKMVPFQALVYVPDTNTFVEEDKVPAGARTFDLSGTELRRHLAEGCELPAWFTFPEVARELRHSHRPRRQQGLTIFFTGLSGAGKSTIANALLVKLLEAGGRPVSLLDGDLVRKHLSSELGFSKEHRDLNIRRIGYVASEITKHGGIAVCAPIAPYQQTRRQVREMIQPHGGFVLVHVATPIEECERRDRKGLYAKARAGLVKEFTGVSDPYESPTDADIVLDTLGETPEQSAQKVLYYLQEKGYIE
jgi:sulfate adenylyltransferase